MRFVVYGAGAIGGLIGALLAEHGEDVRLIARGAHAAAIETSGLVVESPEGRRVLRLPVAVEPDQIRPGEVVLLAMKSQDTGPALASLRQVAPPATPVVCLQNGVENERAALRLFPNVYAVCVLCPAAHLEPGVVQSFSAPVAGLLDIGRFPAGTDAISKQVAAAFRAATFESVERSDIMRWKYRKLLMNLNNAVEAIVQPPGRAEISQLVQDEGVACLQAAGIEFVSAEEDLARRADVLKMHAIGDQPRGGGSSWQSLQRRAGSIESDYLNGEIVLLGRRLGIPTPANALLQELAVEMARNGTRPGAMSASVFLQQLDGRQAPPAPAATG
jgi:2-dehydropantoate 2-reductase